MTAYSIDIPGQTRRELRELAEAIGLMAPATADLLCDPVSGRPILRVETDCEPLAMTLRSLADSRQRKFAQGPLASPE